MKNELKARELYINGMYLGICFEINGVYLNQEIDFVGGVSLSYFGETII